MLYDIEREITGQTADIRLAARQKHNAPKVEAYMPALVAARFNPDLRQRYQTIIMAGKPAKVALTALMRKLMELASALVQQDRKWTPKTA